MFREILFGLEALAYVFLKVMAGVFLLVIFVNAGPIVALLVAVFGVCVYLNYKRQATKERFYERYANAPANSFASHQVTVKSEFSVDDSEYKIVIEASKKLESQLAELNAVGKGLHEKVTSIETKLPNELVSLLRRVATVRNKLIHEVDFELSPRQLRDFKNYSEDAYEDLEIIVNGDSRMSSGQLSTARDRKLLDDDDDIEIKQNNFPSKLSNQTSISSLDSPDENRREIYTRTPPKSESENVLCFTCGYRGKPTHIKEKEVIRYSCCAKCSEILKVHSIY